MLLVQGTVLGILVGGMYALMASGLTLIFGVMRLINIGHAAVIIFASYLSWNLLTSFGIDPLVSIPILVVVFFVAGMLLQKGVLSALVDKDLSLALLATLGVANVLEGMEGAFWTSSFHAINTAYSNETYVISGIYVPLIRIITFAASVVLLGGLYVLLSHSNLGRAIRATTQNRSVAQLVGVNVNRITMIAFGIGIAVAAAAGPLMGMYYPFYPNSHWGWIGKLMAIVVLGGLGSFRGTLLAALILGIAEQVAILYIPANWAAMVFFVFLFAVLIVRPQGFFGHVARESL
ncbi:MAG: branched-chain amino acid ABC transporter permease [Candidatus Dormibacteraeota bacterium]|nr:branched-chain amino acid ABC transporter permease [Candidatus Dormibacteraeota bacterium]